jgi:predicted S18 family serine protease
MKKLMTLVVLTSCLAIPSFAGDVVGHSAKVVGKDSAKAVTVTAKDSAKAVTAAAKFLF